MLFAVLASLVAASSGVGPGVGVVGPAYDLDAVLARARPASEALAADAELARADRELQRSRGLLREGPALSAEAGPRRTPEGDDTDVALALELPLAAGRGERTVAFDVLETARRDLTLAAKVESRLALQLAYVAAWEAREGLTLARRELAAAEAWLAAVESRVVAGAEAPYEASLVAAEAEAARFALATAGERSHVTWAALRALADLAEVPGTLAEPVASLAASEPPRSGTGEGPILERAVRSRAALERALAALETARDDSRWALGAALGREGDEDVARLGVGYRFPLAGETAARRAVLDTVLADSKRREAVDLARLEGQLAGARERAAGLAGVPRLTRDEVEKALAALEARLAAGRDRPSQSLPLRRQLLNSLSTALAARAARLRSGYELEALTTESFR